VEVGETLHAARRCKCTSACDSAGPPGTRRAHVPWTWGGLPSPLRGGSQGVYGAALDLVHAWRVW
jgi:hypothetical protein